MKEHIARNFTQDDPFGPKMHRAVLGFEYNERSKCFLGRSQRPFRPRGLALFGMGDGLYVRCYVGTELQTGVSYPALPAKFFLSGLSFEEICKRADEGAEIAAWSDFRSVEPGIDVTVHITDRTGEDVITPEMAVCMWGYALTY